jgi:adenylate cyclase 10
MLLYDTLTSFEQLICKCTSLLGETFSRQMLTYVLLNNERAIAEAIVNLFEQKILMCASDDFSVDRSTNEDITCRCKIFYIPQMCRDLPKYACCNHTKFVNSNFQKTIYELLTENQRIEYHKRSLMFLYHRTRKCDSCDGGFFEKLVYNSKGFEFNAIKAIPSENQPVKKVSFRDPEYFRETIKHRFKRSKPLVLEKEGHVEGWFCVLGLMKKNLGKCGCNLILYDMYKQ